MAEQDKTDLTTLTVDLLSAYFASNTVDSGQLAGLIRTTHDALKSIDAGEPEPPAEPEFTPAVSARKSLSSPDHILSMIDGKPYKTLKRHLARNGLTPAEYRERYNLPASYPMVAPSFAQLRRDIAGRIGLGRKSMPAKEAGTPTTPPKRRSTKALTAPAIVQAEAPSDKKAAARRVSKPKAPKADVAPAEAKPRTRKTKA